MKSPLKVLIAEVLLGAFFYSCTVFAASQATHVYFAQLYLRICKPTYTQKERDAFIRGTLFPDIRYIAKITREKTHTQNVRLQDIIKAKNPYDEGKELHCFVDEKREEITTRMNMYALLKDIPKGARTHFLKIVEDEILYKDIDIPQARHALKIVPKKEAKAIDPFMVKSWHQLLDYYLQQSPSLFFKKKNDLVTRFAGPAIEHWNLKIADYAKNKKIVEYVTTLKNEFEKMFNAKKRDKLL